MITNETAGVVPAIIGAPGIWQALCLFSSLGQVYAISTFGCDLIFNHSDPAISSSVLGAVFIGLISSTTPVVIESTLSLTSVDWQFRFPKNVLVFPFAAPFRTGLIGSLFYAFSTDPHHLYFSHSLLTRDTARALLAVFIISHNFFFDIFLPLVSSQKVVVGKEKKEKKQ